MWRQGNERGLVGLTPSGRRCQVRAIVVPPLYRGVARRSRRAVERGRQSRIDPVSRRRGSGQCRCRADPDAVLVCRPRVHRRPGPEGPSCCRRPRRAIDVAEYATTRPTPPAAGQVAPDRRFSSDLLARFWAGPAAGHEARDFQRPDPVRRGRPTATPAAPGLPVRVSPPKRAEGLPGAGGSREGYKGPLSRACSWA